MKHLTTMLSFWALISLSSIIIQAQQADCGLTSGQTTRETYPSAILGQNMFYTVYTPPCYAPSAQPYPVVYLMHGSNENDEHWVRLGIVEHLNNGITNGTLPDMVVVMPFGNLIANRNWFDYLSWGNIFVQELMPDAERKYNIGTTQALRAIGGISRGGFWAYQIGFSHPEMFSAIGGHSGFFDLYHAEDQYNPLDLALSAPGLDNIRLYIDRGAEDFAAPGLDIMGERLAQRGLDHQYIVRPDGIHYNTYWVQHVEEYLQFYAADWRDAAGISQVVDAASSTPPPDPTQVAATNIPIQQQQTSQITPTIAPISNGLFVTNTPMNASAAGLATITPTQVISTQAPPTATQLATTAAPQGGLFAVFPAVGFPSLQVSVDAARLQAIAAGNPDGDLILTPSVLAALQAAGFPLAPNIRTVPEADLRSTLWRERTAFTLLPIDQLTQAIRPLLMNDVPVPAQLDQYPFAVASATPNFDPDLLTRITYSGVTAMTRNTRAAIDANSVAWAAEALAPYVTQSDFFHISNEVSIVPTCPQAMDDTLGGTSSMCTKPAHFDILNLLDVDIVELTGNHNNDYGYQAYTDTLDWYAQNGLSLVGGGATLADAQAPLITEYHGNVIGHVACNDAGPYYALVNEDPSLLGGVRPGAAACDRDWLEATLPTLAQQVDVLVVTVQHPEIEDYLPPDNQRFFFRRLADLGADVVMGTAAHKPQTYEFYQAQDGRSAFIHYGMGNLYFDQPFWGNMRFFLNTIYVYDGALQTVEVVPGIIDDLARPRLMTPEEQENFLFFMFNQQNGF